METTTDDDLTVTERWALSQEGNQVTHVVEITAEQLKSPIYVTRVFDREK